MKLYRNSKDAYFLSDGETKIKLTRGMFRTATINGKVYDIDAQGNVFDSSNRKWDENVKKFFYPLADDKIVETINEAYKVINK